MNKVKLYRPYRALIDPFKKHYRVAHFPMCFTPSALEKIALSIGSYQPETGGKLFGPTDKMGIDVFEFDRVGSVQAGAAIYAPDVSWGNDRVEYHLDAKTPRHWWGDIHSHPGGYGRPSPAVGDGLGDLGYAAKVFEENEAPLWYFMPIVTLSSEAVFISPFLINRNDPHRPFIAPAINVCDSKQFPDAEFNPVFLKRIESVTANIAKKKKVKKASNQRSFGCRKNYWKRTNDRRAYWGI